MTQSDYLNAHLIDLVIYGRYDGMPKSSSRACPKVLSSQLIPRCFSIYYLRLIVITRWENLKSRNNSLMCSFVRLGTDCLQ